MADRLDVQPIKLQLLPGEIFFDRAIGYSLNFIQVTFA